MADYESVAALIASIEAVQTHLRGVLSEKDEAMLRERPVPGKWSVLEHVRHLVFAEHVHFARFVSTGRSWRQLEPLPPYRLEIHLAPQKMVGRETTSMKELIETWGAVHESTRTLLAQDTDEVRAALTRHRKHLWAHVKTVESLLKVRRT